jgi:hypothetical protein
MKPTKAELKKAKNLLNKYAPKGEELAYINSKEAKLLKRIGGAGKDINGIGIKSYYGSDDYGAGEDGKGSSGPSGGGGGNGDNDDNYNAADAYFSPTKSKTILDSSPTFQAAKFVFNKIKGFADKRNPRSKLNDPTGLYAEGLTTGSRNNINMGGGDNNNFATNVGGKIIKLAPTSAEISQSNATDVTYDSRKTKARGRSMTIRTNSRGVGNNMASVLGKKSLLGAA